MTDTARRPIRKLAIVGGGTAGWIAAATLAHHFRGRLFDIELVESDDIGTIGVGESTIPPFLEMLSRLGVPEPEFMAEVGASFKLGIAFRDWRERGESYFHPFGEIGSPTDAGEFYQCWLKATGEGYRRPLQDFAPATMMARAGRFALPFQARGTPIGGAAYAVHVDAKRVAAYLRRFSEARGVKRTEGLVDDVQLDARGFVERLRLRDGRTVEADFFIDCSGFRALLIGKALGVGYHDWKRWLPCDRAIAVQTRNIDPPAPYTLAHAQDAGWRWRIPLQHRTGNGHVFDGDHIDDQGAIDTLLGQVEGEVLTTPMVVPFRTGVRQRIWDRNVLSLGLAAGFVEPLESTAIHLVYRGMDFFFRYMPDRDCDPALAEEYNRRMTMDYEEIRDFIVLHYCTTRRDDTPFWRHCGTMDIPDTLKARLALFRANGTLREGVDELFRAASWRSVMEGMGVRPRGWHPTVDRVDAPHMVAAMDRAADALSRQVATLPTHQQAIDRHCASADTA